MQTKYDVGDTVKVEGTITEITIDKNGVTYEVRVKHEDGVSRIDFKEEDVF